MLLRTLNIMEGTQSRSKKASNRNFCNKITKRNKQQDHLKQKLQKDMNEVKQDVAYKTNIMSTYF